MQANNHKCGVGVAYNSKLEVKQRVVPVDLRFESCVNWCKWGGLRGLFNNQRKK